MKISFEQVVNEVAECAGQYPDNGKAYIFHSTIASVLKRLKCLGKYQMVCNALEQRGIEILS